MLHTLVVIDKTLIPRVIWYNENLNELIQSVNALAHNMGFIFKPDTSLFGGYYVNPVNGDGYLIDYPIE